MDIHVVKRNGLIEKFNPDKINALLDWAVKDLNAVAMDIAMRAEFGLFDGIPTSSIHSVLVDSAVGLISVESPDYQYVAGRLTLAGLRKQVWGGIVPPSLHYLIQHNHDAGVYADWVVQSYTEAEIHELDQCLQHDRDFNLTAAAVRQLMDKYLVQDRVTKRVYETPQFMYMLIAMGLYRNVPDRLRVIKEVYDDYTMARINLPTPTLSGMRSRINSYASCALLQIGDSLDSIMSTATACAEAVSSRYGLGLDASSVRAEGSPIRGGESIHSGVIPILKIFEAIVRGIYQGGVRRGSATVCFNWWHYEMPEILMLKAVTGAEEQRVRHLDYCILFEGLFQERALQNRDVTLFSPHEVPELLANMGMPEFRELYEAAETNPAIRMKRRVKARDLLSTFLIQRFETTRYYAMFVDSVNNHCSWLGQVRMTNLCTEITHPVTPLQKPRDIDAEAGVCILSAVNVLTTSPEQLEEVCYKIVLGLDQSIDLQDYFTPGARTFATTRRSLGVGITNLAALFASEGLAYDSPEAPNRAAQIMESVSYYLIKASVRLAQEYGPCDGFYETKWSQGLLPIDTYKKTVDEFVTEPLHHDWEWLRSEIAIHGMRHSTLTAIMPVESSSVLQNATNGIEPPKTLFVSKSSKSGFVPMLVPGIGKFHQNYKLAFEYENNVGFFRVIAALQKFTDMAISANAYYQPSRYKDGLVPQSVLMRDHYDAYRFGLHTMYYLVADDGDQQSAGAESGCAGGGCAL